MEIVVKRGFRGEVKETFEFYCVHIIRAATVSKMEIVQNKNKWNAATPKGLNIKARGCAYSRYPGYGRIQNINPNGVAHYLLMCNPVGVEISSSRKPGVARIRATPGSDVQPPWGCLA